MPVCDIDQNIVAHGSKGAELQHVTSTGMEWNAVRRPVQCQVIVHLSGPLPIVTSVDIVSLFSQEFTIGD